MASETTLAPARRLFSVAWLVVLWAQLASAAPGFIAGSFVTGDGETASMSFQFRCGIEYVSHEPASSGDSLRVRLEATRICSGAAPGIASNREQHRPINADKAHLISVEYDGDSPSGQILRFDFDREVRFDEVRTVNANTLLVRISPADAAPPPVRTTRATPGRLLPQNAATGPDYVINLQSSLRSPATADIPDLELDGDKKVFVSQAVVDGQTWYRLRIGYFTSADEAARALRELRTRYPTAWIDRAANDGESDTLAILDSAAEAIPESAADLSSVEPASGAPAGSEIERLMQDGRRSMIAGELSRAIQIYTKVLQMPDSDHQQEAQEYLALARERNGQLAHAKAEYERYLAVYGDTDDAARVRQRLDAMLASAAGPESRAGTGGTAQAGRQDGGNWSVRTFASQYYRRDANQLNDEDEIISQSAVFSDISLDTRRRGQRFDFSARLTGGHFYDLLDDPTREVDKFRLSYAYTDLADAKTRIRGRLGRQTRNSGGVLGRFDGLNISYGLTERVQLETVIGTPVFSTTDGVDDERSFYGLSTNFGPIRENIDIRVYALKQDIRGLTDRQTIGGEFRYFGQARTLWAMVDYDTAFQEIGSMFLQSSWRFPSKLTLTALVDHRQSPYLSLGNAIVGQPVEDFEQLTILFSEDELQQLALDRSAATTTVTLGLSKALSPKLQLGFNATQSTIEATPASGGVPANPATDYAYYSVDLVASSLFSKRDVSIFGLRYSESDNSNIYTLNLDSRFRIGRAWRISPRIRVDYREILTDNSQQWTYTPGLRLEYRPGRKVRVELTTGKQFSAREMEQDDQDRESSYVSVGYQLFF